MGAECADRRTAGREYNQRSNARGGNVAAKLRRTPSCGPRPFENASNRKQRSPEIDELGDGRGRTELVRGMVLASRSQWRHASDHAATHRRPSCADVCSADALALIEDVCAEPAKTITRANRTQAARDTHKLCAHWQTHIASPRYSAVRQTRTRFAHSGKRQLVWMGCARMMHGGYGWKTTRMMPICRGMGFAACIPLIRNTACRAVTGNAAFLRDGGSENAR